MRHRLGLLLALGTLHLPGLQGAPVLEPIPDKLVVLTFDDSKYSHYSFVRSVLRRYKFNATFFITEGFGFETDKREYMSWTHIGQLHREGYEIGNLTRDHTSITAANLPQLEEQIEAINKRCEENGIPRPVSFAYPGNAILAEAMPVLKKLGLEWGRRGGSPEFDDITGRGPTYDPKRDHPLLIPSTGEGRPGMSFEDFKGMVQRARNGRIVVLQFHGVPDNEHPWASVTPAVFRLCMKYLSDEAYTVIALRDLARYVDPASGPRNPLAAIEQRKARAGREVTLRGEVVDESTLDPLAARVYLQDETGAWFHPASAGTNGWALRYQKRNWINTNSVEMHTTLSADPFEIKLKPGSYTITVERGKEYFPLTRVLEVEDDPTEVTLELRRWVNMARLGWYSGDVHVHRPIHELTNVMLAEDLNVALPQLAWVTKAFEAPAKVPPLPPAEVITVDPTHVVWPRNTEYEIFTVDGKKHTLGALLILNQRGAFEQGGPPMQPISARAHAEGALLDLEKHDWPWSMALVPVLGLDLYELANNHLWRTEFALTNWNSAAAEFMELPQEGRGGTELDWIHFTFRNYYTLLNCGFRLRPSAGSANGVLSVPLGFSRVYVHLDGPFRYDEWLKGLNAGRSFVTTGPMLMVTVNEQKPGFSFAQSGRFGAYQITGAVLSDEPLQQIDLIVNGEVAKSISAVQRRTMAGAYEVRFTDELNLNQTSWVAVRCFSAREEGRVRFAHTAPFWIEVPGKPLRPRRAEVAYLIRRVEEQLERSKDVLPPAALEEYRKAKAIYEELARTAR